MVDPRAAATFSLLLRYLDAGVLLIGDSVAFAVVATREGLMGITLVTVVGLTTCGFIDTVEGDNGVALRTTLLRLS